MMRSVGFLTVLLLMAGVDVASARETPSWGVGALMSLLQQNQAQSAQFVEVKQLPLLSRPLRSSGTLRYSPPDILEMDTQTPRSQQLRLTGDTVRLTEKGVAHEFSLRFHPMAAAVVDSIRGTLAGNRGMLERHYYLRLAGHKTGWTLHLAPRGALRHRLVAIDVRGAGRQVRQILVREAGGERDRITITGITR